MGGSRKRYVERDGIFGGQFGVRGEGGQREGAGLFGSRDTDWRSGRRKTGKGLFLNG